MPSSATTFSPTGPVDFILVSGAVFTADPTHPWAEALAVSGEYIHAVGDAASVRELAGQRTTVLEWPGALILPGFNDAHVHFADGGFSLVGLDLRDADDEGEFRRRIAAAAAAAAPEEWLTGGNWDHQRWPSRRLPDRFLLDDVCGEHPVLLCRLDKHLFLANTLALRLAGIDAATAAPVGGEIVRAADGQPSGILKDTAADLVARVIPAPSPAARRAAVQAALRHAAGLGVTSVQDNTSVADLRIYQELHRAGRLTARINAWVWPDRLPALAQLGITPPFGDDTLRLGTVKLFSDGSLGASSALFFEPYSDDPNNCGLAIHGREELASLIAGIDAAGLQAAAHAIGDRANDWVLQAFEALPPPADGREPRHRIEHAQSLRPADIARFRRAGVIASVQPAHCSDDLRWAGKRLGTRQENLYPFASLARAGVRLAFGSDWPVAPLDPRLGLYAAVTRQTTDGEPQGGFFPEERLPLARALEYYTAGSAFAEFQEGRKGSLTPGRLADIVVLDRNLLALPAAEILHAGVLLTMMGGRVVFRRQAGEVDRHE